MTKAQENFCNEYLIDFNAARAYKVTYKSCKTDETAYANSSRLLRNAKVQEYIQKRIKEREERTEITQDQVINELAKIAFFNPKEIFNDNGSLKNIKDIEDKDAGVIIGIDSYEEYIGRGEEREAIGETKKIKFADKLKALELLGKHLGMFKEEIKVNGKVETTNPFSGLTTEELRKIAYPKN